MFRQMRKGLTFLALVCNACPTEPLPADESSSAGNFCLVITGAYPHV